MLIISQLDCSMVMLNKKKIRQHFTALYHGYNKMQRRFNEEQMKQHSTCDVSLDNSKLSSSIRLSEFLSSAWALSEDPALRDAIS
jgi:hypothetical protein